MSEIKPPEWFDKALGVGYEDAFVSVGQARIHYLLWTGDDVERKKPGLVFVHGNGAHAHWWTFIAPFFLSHYRIAAIDLAGAGDSDHLQSYTSEGFTEQVMAVIEDAGFGGDTVVIGHSFGGYVALKTGLLHRDRLMGIVLADSAVRPPDFEWEHHPRSSPIKPKRTYETFEAALARFRLMPPQDCENGYLLDYIGQHSLKKVADGWTWKFDEHLFTKFEFAEEMHENLANLRCRVGVIYGEDSYLFTQAIADFMFEALNKSVPFTGIPCAQHHLFLDQPLAFVSSLRTLLAEWRHSKPQR